MRNEKGADDEDSLFPGLEDTFIKIGFCVDVIGDIVIVVTSSKVAESARVDFSL